MSDQLRVASDLIREVDEDCASRKAATRKVFSDELRRARMAKGVAVRELARRADVSPAFVSDTELGRRSPGPEVRKRLILALS